MGRRTGAENLAKTNCKRGRKRKRWRWKVEDGFNITEGVGRGGTRQTKARAGQEWRKTAMEATVENEV